MATTSAELARFALEGFREAGVPFAVLHGYDRLQNLVLSDIDLVVGWNPHTILRASTPFWNQRGLIPILAWPYDIGGTMTVFLATADARDGVQLDLLYDPEGRGKGRVRSEALLSFSEERTFGPVVGDAARLVYLWQKGILKSQDDRLLALRREAVDVDHKQLADASLLITGSLDPARGLAGVMAPRRPRRGRQLRSRLGRLVSRAKVPIGLWAHVVNKPVGEELNRRLAGYLVTVRSSRLPALWRQILWYATQIAPVRYRPGAFISYGDGELIRRPDIEIVSENVEQAASELIESMSQRLMSHVSLM